MVVHPSQDLCISVLIPLGFPHYILLKARTCWVLHSFGWNLTFGICIFTAIKRFYTTVFLNTVVMSLIWTFLADVTTRINKTIANMTNYIFDTDTHFLGVCLSRNIHFLHTRIPERKLSMLLPSAKYSDEIPVESIQKCTKSCDVYDEQSMLKTAINPSSLG